MSRKQLTGFTLIELMIVVVIVALLAAIAYPSYTTYTTRTRRSDAQTLLSRVAALQEKFYAECGWYAREPGGARACGTAGATTSILGIDPTSTEGFYTVSMTAGNLTGACTASGSLGANYSCGFTATATPVPTRAQANNGRLRIDGTGTKQWDRGGSGTFSARWTDR